MIFQTTILFAFFVQTPTSVGLEFQKAVEIGKRVAMVQHSLPLVNQVVLVPDEATYLDELSKWSPQARWPVLFDDDKFAPMFIRKFKPQQVWRRMSVGKPAEDFETYSQTVVAKAWGRTASTNVAFTDENVQPLGVVVTNKNDSARVAAVALAAGRGQTLHFVQDWGDANTQWSEQQTEQRMFEAARILRGSGKNISTITLCMQMSPLAHFSLAKENPVATTDLIGRDQHGNRFAWCGWIFGSKKQTAYMAACSLFLPRHNYWFCNTYPDSGAWQPFGIGNMEEVLPRFGITLTTTNCSLDSLYEVNVGGVTSDVVFFTSKGNQDFLELSDTKIAPTWLPILNTPAVLQFIHSWSLKKPTNRTTVGGTWLDRGVYAYAGSSHEPMLQAFVPPMEVMRRTMSLVPFLPASRWFTGQGAYSAPWRMNTIGDPLMLCGTNPVTNRKRVEAINREDCTNLLQEAKVLLQQTKEIPSDESFAQAIEQVTLLGRDTVAVKLWQVAVQNKVAGARAAKASLPALFRTIASRDFFIAFTMLTKPNRYEQDMLWHLVTVLPDSTLPILIDNIRSVYACDDLRAIGSRIAKSRGNNAVLTIINNFLSKAIGRNERELKRMRKKYGG